MAKKLYRYGVNPDCPVHAITLAGLCFPRTTEKVEGYGADTQRSKVEGMVSKLDEGKFAEVIEAAAHKFVRGTKGKKARHWVVDDRTRGFSPHPDDQPVAQYLYFEEIAERENPFEEKLRPTIAEEFKKTKATAKKR